MASITRGSLSLAIIMYRGLGKATNMGVSTLVLHTEIQAGDLQVSETAETTGGHQEAEIP